MGVEKRVVNESGVLGGLADQVEDRVSDPGAGGASCLLECVQGL